MAVVDDRFAGDGWIRITEDPFVAYIWLPPPDSAGQAWSHGHADAGEVTLFRNGLPVLVDPGQAGYGSDPVSRYGIEASAHNTPVLDGVGAQPGRRARYRSGYRAAASSCLESAPGTLPVRILFEGFKRLHSSLTWRRTVDLRPGALTIEDTIDGPGYHVLDHYFHLAATLRAESPNRVSLGLADGSAIDLVHQRPGSRSIWERSADGRLGWQWPTYGRPAACTTARYRHVGALRPGHRFVIGDAGCAE